MTTIINETPFLRIEDNFLTPEECQGIIELAKNNMVPGQILDHYGNPEVNENFRSATTTCLNRDKHPLAKKILDRVAEYTGYPAENFEGCTVTSYKTGDQFKNHQDYFAWGGTEGYSKATLDRCRYGGNRISTVLLYLNDVEAGGETFFPWLDFAYKPKMGSLLQFDYGYDDWQANVKTQHVSLPLRSEEKWIISVWIRERSMKEPQETYKVFKEEVDVFSRVQDTKFELVVGPKNDRRFLSLSLPANNHPQHSIVVGFTGGMDSSLLLYLVAMLNSYQLVPYTIHPVCVTNYYLQDDPDSIREDWENAKHMLNVIRGLVESPIKDLQFVSALKNTPRESQMPDGLMGYYSFTEANNLTHLKDVYSNRLIFTGCNESPTDGNPIWDQWPKRVADKNALSKLFGFWKQPFLNLQKHHILDAILQLELDDILRETSKCGVNHTSLLDPCVSFQCNERRWAFEKLGKTELGNQLLVNLHQKSSTDTV